jgi:hypothetical protein
MRERREVTFCRVLMAAEPETPYRPRGETANGKGGRGCGCVLLHRH